MRGSNTKLKSRRRKRLSFDSLEGRQLMATLTVNTTLDNTPADATLSLRDAIEVSNGTLAVSSLSTQAQHQVSGTVGATNTIDFDIPTTDPGYNAATGLWTIARSRSCRRSAPTRRSSMAIASRGRPRTRLRRGTMRSSRSHLTGRAGSTAHGLTIAQQGSQVSGLDFENCSQSAVLISASGGNVQVAGCFVGVDPTGETVASNGYGVEIESSSNVIGGSNVGDRNVISGTGYGVWVLGPFDGNPLGITPTGNVIENNFIGTDATGTKAISKQQIGVEDDGSGNTYGGTAAGFGNVISGNTAEGIRAYGNVTIEGNYIGTDATGNVALGNGNGGTGIAAIGSNGTAISVTITNNVVSGNAGRGSISTRLVRSSSRRLWSRTT